MGSVGLSGGKHGLGLEGLSGANHGIEGFE
jgi:hypothetical protein